MIRQTDIMADALFNSFKSLDSVYRHFTTNRICLEWLSKVRWGNDVICPHCGSPIIYKSRTRVYYHCDNCNRGFSPLVGTIFQSTKLPLRKWYAAIWLTINNKKGVSSMMLSRELDITQKTAWSQIRALPARALAVSSPTLCDFCGPFMCPEMSGSHLLISEFFLL